MMDKAMLKKVLIVEDEEPIIELLGAVFDGLANYRTIYARDGQEALRIARADYPDIVLLDVHLPELDGYEVCRLIKSYPNTSHTKVMMISGMAQNADLIKARKAGADDYITKPFIPTELIEKVKTLIGRK
jgi:DNA-binding response OmpR family regulator